MDCKNIESACAAFERRLAKNPKPCPFCGGEPVACVQIPVPSDKSAGMASKLFWTVSCSICGASTSPHSFPAFALRAWLMRAD